jgi:copper chaperone
MEQATLKIHGMTCDGCVKSVTNVLTPIPGVNAVAVTLQPGEARVTFDAGKTGVDALRKAIENAGYDVVD